MIELLAPAGNIESLKAAVENGADAVYLGLNEFNARLKADNFTRENLAEWVEYAHLFGVKVYLVLNTSIKEQEIEKAIEVVKVARDARVDAYIVTDIGLICRIKNTVPDAVLHFSTQTGVKTLLAAREAENLGAKRVILSREATERDIEEIRQNTTLETEVFVHGALCVSFSGGCLMSSFIGGNSGNRGLCMQPCRQKYKAVIEGKILREGYLLSMSDLCLLPQIEKLKASGIMSLKIEGRLRRSEYVAQVVRTYRKALDGGVISDKDFTALKKIYNRGNFTEGYYYSGENRNRTRGLMSTDIQGHRGMLAGRVGEAVRYNNGDAFKLIRNGKEIGSAVYENNEMKYSISDVRRGDELFITSDAKQLDELKTKNKKLPVEISFYAVAGKPAELTMRHKKVCVKVSSDFEVEAAVSAPVNQESVREQLVKLNNTLFECADIAVNIEGDIFIAKSALNEMRRITAEKLKKSIIMEYYDKQSS